MNSVSIDGDYIKNNNIIINNSNSKENEKKACGLSFQNLYHKTFYYNGNKNKPKILRNIIETGLDEQI